MTKNDKTANLTVYYDGFCALCSAEIGHYETRKGADRLCFVNLAETTIDIGSDLDRGAALRRFHVRKSDGALLSGADAFVEIWSALPGWRWLARLSRLPGMPWLLERAYRLFLPIRPHLSRVAKRLGAKPRTLDTSRDPS